MKKRTLTALILSFVALPLIIIGSFPLKLAVFILMILGFNELIEIKNESKKIPDFIKIISFTVLIIIFFSSISSNVILFDYRLIVLILFVLLIPIIFYHDKNKYSIEDAFYLIFSIIFSVISFSLMIIIRDININYFLYILIIACITDIYAYLGGNLIGKHQLLTSISSNKTIEGMIVGTFMGTAVGSIFLTQIVQKPLVLAITVSLFLSVLGQLGDLFFSSIKRNYQRKDFSNLFPGHGGIMDRLDSITFVLLGFTIFLEVLM